MPAEAVTFEDFMWFLIGGSLAVILLFAVIAWWMERTRRDPFDIMAEKLNLRHMPGRNHDLVHRYPFIDGLTQRDNRYAFNMMEGTYKGHAVAAFDCRFETPPEGTGGKREPRRRYVSFAVLHHEMHAPTLYIMPAALHAKLPKAPPCEAIKIAPEAPGTPFVVMGDDPEFARRVCQQGLMEYAALFKDCALLLSGDMVALWAPSKFKAEEITQRFERLVKIKAAIEETSA